jgi:hypothetical protein
VLEIAVEWSMPAVERWAVAWLLAAGGSQFRMRWSSRSRDGRIRRDGLAAAGINVLSGGQERAIIGCESGSVESWSNEAGLTPAGSIQSPVWAIAADKEKIFAAGADADFFATPQVGVIPSLQKDGRLQVAGITAAALSPSGVVACGDEVGHVFVCRPGGQWIRFSSPGDDARVLALAFRGDSALRVAWRDGWAAEATCPPSGAWAWAQRLAPAASGVRAAAFDGAGQRLAIAEAAGVVRVVIPPSGAMVQAWIHPGVRSVAWSPEGLLATAGEATIRLGGLGAEPEQIRGEDAAGVVAFLGADHLVAAQGTEVVQWALREAGSDTPEFAGEDRITAVAVDPGDPGHCLAGTWQGRLLQFDSAGSLAPLCSGETIRGPVHQMARAGSAWLIAAQTGAFRWDTGPEAAPMPLARRMCRAVAGPGPEVAAVTGHGGAFAANHEVRTVDGEPLFTFKRTVLDVRYGPGGCIAAIDQFGSIQARDPAGAHWQAAVRAGSRLLVAGPESVIVRFPGGEVVEVPRRRQYRKLGQLPADTNAAVSFDDHRVLVVSAGRGFGLAGISEDAAGASSTLGIRARATTAATDGHRIVVAAGRRIAGYDLLQPTSVTGNGIVGLAARLSDGKCEITLPSGTVVRVPPQVLAALRATQAREFAGLLTNLEVDAGQLWESAARLAIDGQSRIVSAAGRLAELIWQAGLDLAVDLARGDDPDRPVRLAWSCDDQADDLPWELVQPTASTLGWFDDPPTTVVRTVGPALSRADTHRDPAGGPLARYTMLVIRGNDVALDSSDLAYQRTRRRTRRSNIELLSTQPGVISEPGDLDRVLRGHTDILQVWAHCGPQEVEFSASARLPADELADRLAACSPRLVVLVGCRSGALGRALVRRGVAAVVAMRVEVYSDTVQPLVEDLVSLALAGRPVDLAFAEALRRYVLTGQPGAVAVPMLYLAGGSSGRLFTPSTTAVPAWLSSGKE